VTKHYYANGQHLATRVDDDLYYALPDPRGQFTLFANALINYSWRNNSGVEEIHAGQWGKPPYSLTHRRLRPAEERHLFRLTASRMVEGVMALTALEKAPGQWVDKVIGYRLSPYLFPRRWSLTEHTCQFHLPGTG
jgi:hypothetical protein